MGINELIFNLLFVTRICDPARKCDPAGLHFLETRITFSRIRVAFSRTILILPGLRFLNTRVAFSRSRVAFSRYPDHIF